MVQSSAMNTDYKNLSVGAVIVAVVLVGFLGYGGYQYVTLKNVNTMNELAKVRLTESMAALQTNLSQVELERTSLSDALVAEKEKNDEFEKQIKRLAGTVGDLTKLSQTDPELLKKYSKVSFLNENYVPSRLGTIDTDFVFDKKRKEQFESHALPFLKRLLSKAENEDLDLLIASSYRSFGTQASLKSGYIVTYGAGTANQFSAEQGFSEHQLGTAVDFTTTTVGGTSLSFENTPEFKWLNSNAYKYGFILSYPKGNTYYQYEPWHWRFVGIDLAERLHRDDKNFYDLDQREIDKYLINVFD